MSEVRLGSGSRERLVPWLLAGTGVALLVAFVLEVVVFRVLGPGPVLDPALVVAFLLVAPAIGGLVYGGYWLAASDVTPDRYVRVGWWTLAGGAVLFGINVILQVLEPVGDLQITVGLLRGSLTIGGAIGLLVGVVEARAIHNAVEAERSELRAGYLEAQRDWLDYLNGVLRHEVLNTAQVVVGYVDVIRNQADVDEEADEQLGAIRRQTRDMTEVIQDVRLLIDATHGADELEPVDIGAVLREEVRDLRDTADSATVEVNLASDLTVWGDALMGRIFSNLLSNAVEHNDSGDPTVAVSAERSDGRAVVRVADDGSGVPPERQDELFELSRPTGSEPGVGLHLVSLLVERYGGSVELAETGPEGSVFAVELPLADDDPADATPSTQPARPIEPEGGSDSDRASPPPAEPDRDVPVEGDQGTSGTVDTRPAGGTDE